jgi:hypothetical protein
MIVRKIKGISNTLSKFGIALDAIERVFTIYK